MTRTPYKRAVHKQGGRHDGQFQEKHAAFGVRTKQMEQYTFMAIAQPASGVHQDHLGQFTMVSIFLQGKNKQTHTHAKRQKNNLSRLLLL